MLIHCRAGVNRSPTIVVAYLMRHEGQSLRQALAAVTAARPLARPHSKYMVQLVELEKQWHGADNASITMEEIAVIYPSLEQMLRDCLE